MNTTEALIILRALADGIDPMTGEVFPDDNPCQHSQVVRALFKAIEVLEEIEGKEKKEEKRRRDKHLPRNAGNAWDQLEDKMLGSEFDAGMTIKELAQKYERTQGAI